MKSKKYLPLALSLSLCALAPRAGRASSADPWRIEIPRLGVDADIHEGDDAATLRVSVGHIPGTALPGKRGNVALAAHRYSHFRGLRNARCGDRITVTTPGGEYLYEVDSIRVVEISQVEVLNPTPDPTLTLVTCFPFDYVGEAPQRLIVRAHQVESPVTTTIQAVAAADTGPAATTAQK